MIKFNLEITEPGPRDAAQLRALAAMFVTLAEGNKADQVRAALEEKTTTAVRPERVAGTPPALVAQYGQLAAADNPAAGIPSPVEAFGGHGSPELDADAAKLEALAGAGAAGPTGEDLGLPPPAAAFGGAGNVPAPVAGNLAISAPQTGSLPPVPSSVPSAAGAPAPGVELDSEGLPWDASIHASTKAKLANGAWKVKRGTPELYLKERKELLRAALNAGNGAPAGVPATPPAGVMVPPPAGAGAPVPPPPASSPGNVPAPTVTPPVSGQITPGAASSSTVTLAQVLPRVTAAIAGGLLTVDSSAALVKDISNGQIDNVAMLAVAPALIPALVARLDALGIPA